MGRLWPVIALLAAAIILGIVLFGSDPSSDDSLPDGDDYLDGDVKNPELMAAEAVRRKKAADAAAARRKAAADAERKTHRTQFLFLQGTVVDDATGKPIAGATLTSEAAQEPCPRLPFGMALMRYNQAGSGPAPATTPASAHAGAEGRFRWMVDAAVATGQVDVFARAPGYVTSALCKPVPGSDLTIRLKKALKLAVLVTDRHARPVEGARVLVQPGAEPQGELGHTGFGVTDEDGRCEVDGLLAGDVMVTADHPEFMPATDGPIDPAEQSEVELRLPPAMRLTFQIRSDDTSDIKNPTLRWTTDGNPPHEDLLILPVRAGGPPANPLSEVKSETVRIPCDHRNVQLELKADGFEAWRPPAEPLPAEGGEKDVIAVLVRDTSLASLRFKFVDEDGKAVSFAAMKGVPSILRLDAKDPGSVVLEGGETLFFPALPAGPYRIGVRCPDHAPVEKDVDVVAGEANEVTVTLRAPAKLKVVFRSSERITVRFRLRRDGRILPAFPVGGTPTGSDASGLQPLVAQGSEGATFTGLDAGPVTIDITDPTLSAEIKTVTLREGETTEVEIDVRKR